MALILVGRSDYQFTTKEGTLITGTMLHCLDNVSADGKGYRVDKFSLSNTKPAYATAQTIPLGAVVTPVYNRYGKVDDIIWKTPEGKFKLEF